VREDFEARFDDGPGFLFEFLPDTFRRSVEVFVEAGGNFHDLLVVEVFGFGC
jgi:hypothetical protein